MRELTKKEISRQDFVDNAIFDLIKELNLSSKEIDWNIEMIGEIRDIISIIESIRYDLPPEEARKFLVKAA